MAAAISHDEPVPISASAIPIIDIGALVAKDSSAADKQAVADKLRAACMDHGFFLISNTGVPVEQIDQLHAVSKKFFSLSLTEKMKIRMELAGKSWRGFFPVGGELTSGVADLKEGIYFGQELPSDHPDPMHGPNLFPDEAVPEMREIVLQYTATVTEVAQAVARGLSLSLGLAEDALQQQYFKDPLVLFRIFNYPDSASNKEAGLAAGAPVPPVRWGVGEHTDYGFLTVLLVDECGGLQVKTRGGWVEVPVVPGTFVCNIGDMLDGMTKGFYRSTAHRVRNTAGKDRLSFPLFFDPGFHAVVKPVPGVEALKEKAAAAAAAEAATGAGGAGAASTADAEAAGRWDGKSVQAFLETGGTYGHYILGKVEKVFPELRKAVL